MPRATKTELEWAYIITREKILKQLNEKGILPNKEWENVSKSLIENIINGDAPIYETKMNEFLEKTVSKYLRPTDDFISLTDIAKSFDDENPGYLIQSWLRSRNTVEFLATWERKNNPNFDEKAYQKLVLDSKTPQVTLTPKKWIDATNAIGITSKQGKGGGTMAHPFIACDFEMWNNSEFRYEILKYFTNLKMKVEDGSTVTGHENE